MSIEQVVDDYLSGVRHIIGTSPAPGSSSPPPDRAPTFPDLDWTGDAHRAAVAATSALQQARGQLRAAADNVATTTQAARDIAADATTHLAAITTDWEHAKSSVIALPSPSSRDAALLPHAQRTINDAVALISTTTTKYADAAAAVRKHAANLPAPGNGPDAQSPPTPPTDHDEPTPPGSDLAAATTETPGPAPTPSAGNATTSPASLLPTAMGSAMGLPSSFLPMAAALPSAAATPLGGALSPLLQSATTSSPGDHDLPSSSHSTTRHLAQPGSIDQAIDGALDALGITDPQARENWREGYEILVHRESSDRIGAINNGDSNATGPMMTDGGYSGSSRGLAQVTPSTFRSFHVPGTSDDIFDPIANIAASMNYVMHTHGVSPTGADLTTKVAQANASSSGGGY